MTQAPPPSQPVRKLPVFRTVAEGYGSFFRYLRYLPQAALLPVLLTLPLYRLYFDNLKEMVAEPAGASLQPLIILLFNVAFVLIIVLFYVSWFRLTLLGPDAGRPPWFPLPRRRHLCFLWKGFLVVLIYLGIGIVTFLSFILLMTLGSSVPSPFAELLSILWSLVPLVAFLLVTIRFCFVFAAVSVDEPYGLRNAWAHTKGQTLRLFAAVLLTSLPLYLLTIVMTLVVNPELIEPLDPQAPQDPAVVIEQLESTWLSSMLVGLPLGLCFVAIVIGTISAAFKATTGWYPAEPPTV